MKIECKKKQAVNFLLVIVLISNCLNPNYLQVKAISSTISNALFDSNFYANKYPDLLKAYGYNATSLKNHWLNHGIKEGRCASPILDLTYYVQNNEDLKKAFGIDYRQAYNHFVNYGYKEFRNSSPLYYGSFYWGLYTDLRSLTSEELLNHFILYGMSEGRMGNIHFNASWYRRAYSDLQKVYGNNLKAYYYHAYSAGVREGRNLFPGYVTGVKWNVNNMVLNKGSSKKLDYAVVPEYALNKNVKFYSSNALVASVSSNGTVTALTKGVTDITVQTLEGNFKSVCRVTVNVPATGVALNPIKLAMNVGETKSISVTIRPADVSNSGITWSSSNSAVAAVNSAGAVTAKSNGAALITARTNDGGFSSLCEVTVSSRVNGITVTPDSSTVTIGNSLQLSATIAPSNASNKKVKWVSGNSAIATVNSDGLVQALSPGNVTITAITEDGSHTAASMITVYSPITGFVIIPKTTDLNVGKTLTLSAVITPSNASNKKIIWTSSNTSVVSVDANGKLTALNNGSAIIKGTTEDRGFTDVCIVTVKSAVNGISVQPKSDIMETDSTLQLTAIITPVGAENKGIKWSSSNTGIATVDSNGLVTSNNSGMVTITAKTVDGGYLATCVITVKNSVTGVIVTPKKGTINTGESIQLTGKVFPATADDTSLAWISSNPTIAEVDGDGLVTGIDSGVVKITLKTVDGEITDTCIITVVRKDIKVTGITVSPQSYTLNEGDVFALTGQVQPENATNPNIKWSSSNAAVVSVDTSGSVIGISKGTAIITAETEDGAYKAYCQITVPEKVIAVEGVELSEVDMSIAVNQKYTLFATVLPTHATNQVVTWKSSNPSVLTVSKGVVTTKSAGTATVTVTTQDAKKKAVCNITVIENKPVEAIQIEPNAIELTIGESQVVSALLMPTDASNQKVYWSSEDSSIASVDANGEITGVSEGVTTIKVITDDGGLVATCVVDVKAITIISIENI